MIILDTNALPTRGELRNPVMSTLLQAGRANGLEVCVPSIVVDESVNMRVSAASDATAKLRTAVANAGKLFELEPIYLPDPEEVGRSWREDISSTFEVIPVDGRDAAEAFRREALRIPPAREGKGGRDAAVWLTVLRGHQLFGCTRVYFITNNTKDFADGEGNLLVQLRGESEAAGVEVVFCRTLDEALGHLSTPFEFTIAETATEQLLEDLPDLINEFLDSSGGDYPPLADAYVTSVSNARQVATRRALTAGESWLALVNMRVEIHAATNETDELFVLDHWVRIWLELDSDSGPVRFATVERLTKSS